MAAFVLRDTVPSVLTVVPMVSKNVTPPVAGVEDARDAVSCPVP
jgi:hypothetical protein